MARSGNLIEIDISEEGGRQTANFWVQRNCIIVDYNFDRYFDIHLFLVILSLSNMIPFEDDGF